MLTWWLGAESHRRERVGAEVEGEDLQHPQRQRESASGQCPDDEWCELGDVVGEVIGEEPTDVDVRRATLFDTADDAGEVVVEQHEVGCLARDVSARASHRNADVGLVKSRCIVDTVAGHGDDVAASVQGLGDPKLVLGGDPGDHHAVTVEEGSQDRFVRWE
jgi:hypothetical protein